LGATVCFRIAVPGLPWVCPADIAEQVLADEGLLVILAPAVPWVGVPYDCTNADNGYSGIPIPWPF